MFPVAPWFGWSLLLQPKAGGQQHAQGGDHPHQLALLVGGLQHDHGKAGVGAVFGHHALNQGALLALRARRGIAADLPVAMDRPHRALGAGRLGQAEHERHGQQAAEPADRFQSQIPAEAFRLMFRTPHRVDPLTISGKAGDIPARATAHCNWAYRTDTQ